jgi:ppGpp synthetase/RelA/SpoT-type nucleotidyltranferase
MPLSDEIIASAVKQYRRAFDCYEKLCKFVATKCEREIIRANTLRAGVTSRAKAPSKLQGKLQKKYKQEQALNTVEDALGRVSDLAGVRISTYLEVDREKVVQEITKLFDGPKGKPVVIEKKDEIGKFYRAMHCQVALKAEDLREPNDNLEGLTCEIQVCSPLAHVWNELEHDLVYKPTTGDLSDRENESLDILGNLTLSGDTVIKQLFDANSERVKQAQKDEATFQDVYDFVTRIRDAFPDHKGLRQ